MDAFGDEAVSRQASSMLSLTLPNVAFHVLF